MKYCITIIVSFLIFTSRAEGQGADNEQRIDNLKNVMPPSPNASSLGKYGEWPVSLYTGIPNVSIPVYTLKQGSLSVPVSVSYNAAGNKVGEIASWVGLGFSLNGGGMISRSVRGYPDESNPDGFFLKKSLYTNQNDLCSSPVNLNLSKQHKVSVAQGNSDAEQDLYSFNAMGRSFKVFIKADGTIIPASYNKVKIVTNFASGVSVPANVYWTATFEDGTILQFGGTGFMELNTNPRFDLGNTYLPTAWLLKSVKSPEGDIVNFTYNSCAVNQDSYFSQSDVVKYNLSTVFNLSGTPCAEYISGIPIKSRNEIQQFSSMLQLASVESSTCRIEFEAETSERQDLKGGKALSVIKVFSKIDNRYIETYQFNYTYSQAVTSNEYWGGVLTADQVYYKKRLKLVSLDKLSAAGSLNQKWLFDYNPQNLPSRRSFAQDHWGFFNGKTTNTTLLPKYFYPLPPNILQNYNNAGFNPPDYVQGANREGDGTYAQAEILQSVTYPTGGKTTFYFEPNTIPVNEEVFNSTNLATPQFKLKATTNPFTTTQDISFTVTSAQNIFLTLNSYISPNILLDNVSARVTATIINSTTQVSVGGITGNTTSFSGSTRFNLITAGSYILRITAYVTQPDFLPADSITATATLQYDQSLGFQNINKCTGGLRLNKMVDINGIDASKNIEKYYVYENPLIASPVDVQKMYFTETEEYSCEDYVPNTSEVYRSCYNKIITRNSSTRFSLGNIQGGTVGYGKVTTFYGLNGINGKTVSGFTNEDDYGLFEAQTYPYAPTDSREWRRGLLSKQTDYNAAGIKLKISTNTYDFVVKGNIAAFKAGIYLSYQPNGSGCIAAYCTDSYGDCGIQKICYNTTSEQVRQLTTVDSLFDQNGLNPMVTTKTNYYDNASNLQPTRTETTDSKNLVLKTLTYTPLEKTNINALYTLSATASRAIDSMVARNIISPTIQQVQYRNNAITQMAITNYKLWGNNIISPENIEVQVGTNPAETRAQFNKYDVNGNLVEQQKTLDVKKNYLYDYKSTYPIAEVSNADSASIAYTTFESDGLGNWVNTDTARNRVYGITGSQCYSLVTGKSFTKSVVSGTAYIVSYWSRNGAITVTANGTGVTSAAGLIKNGWTYYEHTLPNTTTTVAVTATSALIDELRLYPSTAQMSTYTYIPLVGMTSACSPNNTVVYYEYDAFNGLMVVKDMDKNILKLADYQYQAYAHANAVWQSTGTLRCKPCASNGSYTINMQQHQEKDVNAQSSSYNTFRWVDDNIAGSCAIIPDWQNTATALRCQLNGSSQNTGYQEQEQKDMNPCSSTYNTLRWVTGVYNTTACPLPAANVTLTSSNLVGVSGFTAKFTNVSTSVVYTFTVSVSAGTQTLGTIPVGNYNILISKTGNTTSYYFEGGCLFSNGTSATYNNRSITTTTCKSILIDTDDGT